MAEQAELEVHQCEVIVVDFMYGLGEIARYYV